MARPITYKIWYSKLWRTLIDIVPSTIKGKSTKYKWKCNNCWKNIYWSPKAIERECMCMRSRDYYIWQIYNWRLFVKKTENNVCIAKCIYCSKTSAILFSKSSPCRCRSRKKTFDKLCEKYSDISDCVPAQPASKSFKINLQAVTAYIEANNIPDMKVSELKELTINL